MKILLLILLSFINFICYSQQKSKPCSIYGDYSSTKFKLLNSLKNRNFTSKIDTSVTLQSILTNLKDDTKKYNSNQYVRLTGYIILVKSGGPESCNCHSKIDKDLDIHIELGLTPTSVGKMSMIIEINRFTKLVNSNYTVSNLKSLLYKKVTIEGFLLFDSEHAQNAVVTNPNGNNLWRFTAWEVHPVMKIYLSK